MTYTLKTQDIALYNTFYRYPNHPLSYHEFTPTWKHHDSQKLVRSNGCRLAGSA